MTRSSYKLTPKAEQDLEEIWHYTLENWGVQQADSYVDDLDSACISLARNPETGTTCDHIKPGYLHYRIGRHVIYFRIESDGITVVRILHDRMLPELHL